MVGSGCMCARACAAAAGKVVCGEARQAGRQASPTMLHNIYAIPSGAPHAGQHLGGQQLALRAAFLPACLPACHPPSLRARMGMCMGVPRPCLAQRPEDLATAPPRGFSTACPRAQQHQQHIVGPGFPCPLRGCLQTSALACRRRRCCRPRALPAAAATAAGRPHVGGTTATGAEPAPGPSPRPILSPGPAHAEFKGQGCVAGALTGVASSPSVGTTRACARAANRCVTSTAFRALAA